MTEDEKKAIEDLKEEIKGAEYEGRGNDRIVLKLKTLLNLIEKQQKEIENSVPKEAIREKIEELEKTDNTVRYNRYDIQDILKEILGE